MFYELMRGERETVTPSIRLSPIREYHNPNGRSIHGAFAFREVGRSGTCGERRFVAGKALTGCEVPERKEGLGATARTVEDDHAPTKMNGK